MSLNPVAFFPIEPSARDREFQSLLEWQTRTVCEMLALPPYFFDGPTDMAAVYSCRCTHGCKHCDCICHNGSPA